MARAFARSRRAMAAQSLSARYFLLVTNRRGVMVLAKGPRSQGPPGSREPGDPEPGNLRHRRSRRCGDFRLSGGSRRASRACTRNGLCCRLARSSRGSPLWLVASTVSTAPRYAPRGAKVTLVHGEEPHNSGDKSLVTESRNRRPTLRASYSAGSNSVQSARSRSKLSSSSLARCRL